jgi:hypothetical protein
MTVSMKRGSRIWRVATRNLPVDGSTGAKEATDVSCVKGEGGAHTGDEHTGISAPRIAEAGAISTISAAARRKTGRPMEFRDPYLHSP